MSENPRTLIIRTSWLYGGERYGSSDTGVYKNFVNTMLRLAETRDTLSVVSDQYGIPTSARDFSYVIRDVIGNLEEYSGNILHISNTCEEGSVTWADFTKEIFAIENKSTTIKSCNSDEYSSKAKRPRWSILKNISHYVLPTWQKGLRAYLYNNQT